MSTPERQGASVFGERRLARTVLVLLYLGYLLSFGDRVIFGLVLKPVQATFALSDSELGLLAGAAFALSYAILSPLGGWLVDRTTRKRLLAGAVGFWSLATLLTGLASSFLMLALARVGVGVGEAILNPLAVSLIADTQAPSRRARGYSIYLSAGAVGSVLAVLLGGLLIQYLTHSGGLTLPGLGRFAPWRTLFLFAAVPGIVLVGAALILLREPARTFVSTAKQVGSESTAVRFLLRYPRLSLALFAGVSFLQMGSYTASIWSIIFFERVHRWTAGQAGISLGLTSGASAVAGCILAGPILGVLRSRRILDAPFRLCIGAGVLFMTFTSAAYLSPSPYLSLALMSVAASASYVPSVCAFSAMGEALPPDIRARLAGLHTFANGIISNSLGPLLVGVLSQTLFHGATGIRFALTTTVLIAGTFGTLLVVIGRSELRDRLGLLGGSAGSPNDPIDGAAHSRLHRGI